jgi:hypothetical protein
VGPMLGPFYTPPTQKKKKKKKTMFTICVYIYMSVKHAL